MVEKQFFKNLFTNLNDYNENNLNCLRVRFAAVKIIDF